MFQPRMEIPWIVTYGNWVWASVLAACLAAGPLGLFLARRSGLRKRQRELLADLGQATRNPTSGPVVLVGTIHSEGKRPDGADGTAIAIGTQDEGADARAERLRICSESDSWNVVGNVRLQFGTEWWGCGEAAHTSVQDGDRVMVSGIAHPVADSEPADYRSAASRLELRPGESGFVSVTAVDRATTPRPSLAGIAGSVIAGGLLFVIFAYAIGETYDDYPTATWHDHAWEFRWTRDGLVSAATPFHRQERLRHAAWQAEYGPLEPEASASRYAERAVMLEALSDLQGDCPRAALNIVLGGDVERGIERARSCEPTPRSQEVIVLGLWRARRYGEASREADRLGVRFPQLHQFWVFDDVSREYEHRLHWQQAVHLALLGDRPERAAELLSQASARYARDDAGDAPESQERAQRISTVTACMRAAIAARAGDRAALSELRAAKPLECRLMLIELLPQAELDASLPPDIEENRYWPAEYRDWTMLDSHIGNDLLRFYGAAAGRRRATRHPGQVRMPAGAMFDLVRGQCGDFLWLSAAPGLLVAQLEMFDGADTRLEITARAELAEALAYFFACAGDAKKAEQLAAAALRDRIELIRRIDPDPEAEQPNPYGVFGDLLNPVLLSVATEKQELTRASVRSRLAPIIEDLRPLLTGKLSDWALLGEEPGGDPLVRLMEKMKMYGGDRKRNASAYLKHLLDEAIEFGASDEYAFPHEHAVAISDRARHSYRIDHERAWGPGGALNHEMSWTTQRFTRWNQERELAALLGDAKWEAEATARQAGWLETRFSDYALLLAMLE